MIYNPFLPKTLRLIGFIASWALTTPGGGFFLELILGNQCYIFILIARMTLKLDSIQLFFVTQKSTQILYNQLFPGAEAIININSVSSL